MRDPNLAPTPIQALQRELRARAAELDASARHIERFYNDPDRLQDWLSRDPNAAQDLAHQRVVANAEAEQRARMAEAYAQQARQQAAVAAARQQHQQQHLPSLHRVYVIRCASCDTFLSDRGMRAVLLLKPNIILFSTDAAPSNASPAWPGCEADDSYGERTCECLTTSLSCHGCGSIIGYHIVSPCQRCTASVARHQRTANHHRYVFHHTEVKASERKYFAGESGIVGPRLPLVVQAEAQSTTTSRAATPVPVERPSFEPDSKGRSDPTPVTTDSHEPRPVTPIYAPLKAGDTLYWHNLVLGGERPAPIDPASRPTPVPLRAGR